MAKRPQRIKCPWCGRMVGFSRKGNIEMHVVSTGINCVGVGQPRDRVLAQMKLVAESLKEKR